MSTSASHEKSMRYREIACTVAGAVIGVAIFFGYFRWQALYIGNLSRFNYPLSWLDVNPNLAWAKVLLTGAILGAMSGYLSASSSSRYGISNVGNCVCLAGAALLLGYWGWQIARAPLLRISLNERRQLHDVSVSQDIVWCTAPLWLALLVLLVSASRLRKLHRGGSELTAD